MSPQEFIDRIAPAAVRNMNAFGIPASITIAQAALETGWGSSVKGNNLFGIKGEGITWETREFVDNEWITTVEGFRTYPSWEESIRDHGLFLTERSRYAGVIGEEDYRTAARALQEAGYATDPQYAQKLISIIERWNLSAYDSVEPVEAEYLLNPEDTDKIIRYLSAAWFCTDAEDARAEFHRLANELRRVTRS